MPSQCEHPCYYYSVGRHGPVCSFYGICNPRKTECPQYVPAELMEAVKKQEHLTTQLVTDIINRLSEIKLEDLEKIKDAHLKKQLVEIVLIAKQLKGK